MDRERMDFHDDALDEMLTASAPRTVSVAEAALTTMRGRARIIARPSRRVATRAVAIGIAAILGVAGVSAAAAVVGWAPWAQDPDAIYGYRLPSGAWCEARLGNVQGADDHREVVQAVREFITRQEPITPEDIAAEIDVIRGGESWLMNGSIPTPAGYGTPYYSADQEYNQAVGNVVSTRVWGYLESTGLEFSEANVSYEGETHCPGAHW